MEKIISKEEAVIMLIKRYAIDSTDRCVIESACAVIHQHGVKNGLLQAHRTLSSTHHIACTKETRTCPCLVCRSVRAEERQDRYDEAAANSEEGD